MAGFGSIVLEGLIGEMKIIMRIKKNSLSFARAQLLAHCIYVYLSTSVF